jgi:Signal transduction histidine kinase
MLLLIGGTVISLFEDTYYKTLAKDAILQENAYDVQTLINGYSFHNNKVTEADYNNLKNMLAKYDYQIFLNDGSKRFYSNLFHNQKETLELLRPKITFSTKSVLYVWEDKTVITRKDSYFNIIAIHSAEKYGIFKLNKGTFELLILSFLIVGIGSILVILLISWFFTLKLVNQIMVPIQKLIDGAERIEQGNLDEPILYEGEDEFERVCKSFNKMQESLKAGIEKNAAYEKARTDMISGISHDLRTPLTSVKGYIKGMQDGIANTPEKQEKYLNIAYKKACDMDVLLQKLFYFSKLETGNMPLYPVRTDFVTFLEEFVKENNEYYRENKLEVSLSIQDQNLNVQIDKEQISRVISNIMENSIKYRIHDKINVIMEIKRSDANVIFTITDDGEGVPEEKLSHLFEQFYRVDEARNGKSIGNGLGLYISKYIVEQHGGSISARNNVGLSIEIILPVCV